MSAIVMKYTAFVTRSTQSLALKSGFMEVHDQHA